MTPTTVLPRPLERTEDVPLMTGKLANPWASDQVLLSLSLWWVRMSEPQGDDPSTEVAAVFNSLREQLQ